MVYRLCALPISGQLPLPDKDFIELRQALSEVELVVLVGYYKTLSQLLHVFDVGLPSDAGPKSL